METVHEIKARELFEKGYNCAQAVFAAFADVTGTDEKQALLLSSPFGGGMGRMREVCGAVSGMLMAAGLLYGYDDAAATAEKAELYRKVQELAGSFRETHGSIVCRELLGLAPRQSDDPSTPSPRDEKFRHSRHCADFVADAARILDEYMEAVPPLTRP